MSRLRAAVAGAGLAVAAMLLVPGLALAHDCTREKWGLDGSCGDSAGSGAALTAGGGAIVGGLLLLSGGGGRGRQSPQDALSEHQKNIDNQRNLDQQRRDLDMLKDIQDGRYQPPPTPQEPGLTDQAKDYVEDLIEDFFESVGDIITGEISDRQDAAADAARQAEIDAEAERRYPDN